MMPTDEAFVATLATMPPNAGVALRLLRMLDDPRTSAASLGHVLESDPALSIQIIRLANTTYYGLAEPVASAWRALTVVGLSTARAMITSTAFGLFDQADAIPEGYWQGSLARAACAAALVRESDHAFTATIGIEPTEVFSLGLLQDIGRALLALRAPGIHRQVQAELADRPDAGLVEAERRVMGVDHGEISARALTSARFAPDVVEAVRTHHRDMHHLGTQDRADTSTPDAAGSPLVLVLAAADGCADALLAALDPDRGDHTAGPADRPGSYPVEAALADDLHRLGIADPQRCLAGAGAEYEGLAAFLTFS